MKVGVTGASGLVGQAVCRSLGERGDEVIGFSRSPDRAIPGVSEVRAIDGADSGPRVSGLDAVVHLAGESILGYWTESKKKRILDSRVRTTRALVKAATEAGEQGPRVLVSASGVGYFGDRGDEALTETSPPGSGFLPDVVQAWEGELSSAPASIRTVALRFGVILSSDGGALPPMAKAFKLGLGGRLGSGRQWMPWIHIDDVVGLILEALDNPGLRGPVNAVAPGAVRNAEFTRILADVLGRPAVIPIPAFALRGVLREMGVLFLDSARVVPAKAEQCGYRFRHPSLEEALRSELRP